VRNGQVCLSDIAMFAMLYEELTTNPNQSPIFSCRSLRDEWQKSPTSRKLRMSDPKKGLERAGRLLAREKGARMIEYWPFLDAYLDLANEDGLRALEDHLEDLQSGVKENREPLSPMSQLVNELKGFHITSPNGDEGDGYDSAKEEDSDEDSFVTAEDFSLIFLGGKNRPGPIDHQVLEALQELEVDILDFPNVWRWKKSMQEPRRSDEEKRPQVPKLVMPEDENEYED